LNRSSFKRLRPASESKARLACAALASLVRQEYPEGRTLPEIAKRWGTKISDDQIEALAWLDAQSSVLPNSASASSNNEDR
jgi:hypothetical protein